MASMKQYVRSLLQLFLFSSLAVLLLACGGGADGDSTSSGDSSDAVDEQSEAADEDNDSDSDGEATADTSGLPRFLTEPKALTHFSDLIHVISVYEAVTNGEHTARLEWVGEEEIDGVKADKFHHLYDHPDLVEEYQDFHAWIDEEGQVVEAISAGGEQLPEQMANGFLIDVIKEMIDFDFYHRDRLIDEIPTGSAELISLDTTEDTFLGYDVEVHELNVHYKEDDENFKFKIAEGDNFEIILVEEVTEAYDFYKEIEVKELTFR